MGTALAVVECLTGTGQTRLIRGALPEDTPAACSVLVRSIEELCTADHRNDPDVLAHWLRNKTTEHFIGWIGQTSSSVLVAVENDKILAVGLVSDAGEIRLNDMSPDARFRGISRSMVHALEMRAALPGSRGCTLTSTGTARRFDPSNGYSEDGPPVVGTMTGYPMSKLL